ncbi:hypothetical protein B0T18DRAFT_142534 [Schizothecium vesticola]|uniref:Uncharacterized protein n=1 Tax=Schizothecium vesticola TaxID=314040 RepID=A0AA40EV57_9PEZI|nr:hypothetical protein B0T18DRAFT_142534 [Schizothecium vesticola]
MHPRPIHDPINRPNPRRLWSRAAWLLFGGRCGGSKPFSSRTHPDCHTRHTLEHTHTHMAHGHFTHRSQNEPACLKNRSSDETRARLNHRNSPTAELAWRQERGGPFSAATPEAGLLTQTKWPDDAQKCPAPHPPPPAPPGRPSPPPRLPTRRGRCMAPVRGASERRNAGLMEKIKDDAAREGRELGSWRGGKGGHASLGCIHRRHDVSSPPLPPPHMSLLSPHQPPPPFRLRLERNTIHTIGPTIVARLEGTRRHVTGGSDLRLPLRLRVITAIA